MPDSETEVNNKREKTSSEKSDINEIDNKLLNRSAEKAIEQYRKVRENIDRDLTEKEIAGLKEGSLSVESHDKLSTTWAVIKGY